MLCLEHCIISINNSNFQTFSKNDFYISVVLKILWKMEHLLLRSKCSIFRNIFQNLTFQRRPQALVWSKRFNTDAQLSSGSRGIKVDLYHLLGWSKVAQLVEC